MAIPKVSWDVCTLKSGYDYKTANVAVADITAAAPISSWPIGTIDADGLDKAVTTFLIWNNKGTAAVPSTDVSDMENCKFTCVDANRGNTGAGNCTELLGGGVTASKWMSARNDNDTATVGLAAFISIGNLAPAPIDNGAISIYAAGQSTGNLILGTGNDGLYGTQATVGCYGIVTSKVNLPSTATAGPVSGYLRVSFSYK